MNHGSLSLIDQKILVTLRSVFSSFKDFCMDGWMDGMVIIGHRSFKSTFGANKGIFVFS